MQEPVARSGKTASNKRARQPKPKKSRFRRMIFFIILFTFFIAGGTAAALYWKVDKAIDTVTASDPYTIPSAEPVDTSYHSDQPLSFVILGSDTRKETGSLNTDVMIVAVVNPETKKVTMLSIPRDTRVKIPGYKGYHKINSVFANGEAERRQAEANGQVPTENGITLIKKTLEPILGIPVNHYVQLDFEGFKSIIDELGGVEVNVDRRLIYDDPTDNTHINLQPGLQTLNGEQALGYVRHRHDNRGTKYFSSDFDRNRRQQEVIRSIMDKMASVDGVSKVFNVIDVASQHVHTDLSKEQIKGLAYDFKGISSVNISSIASGAFWDVNTGFTLLPKEKRDEIRSTLRSEMKLTDTSVAELNDSPFSGFATDEVVNSTPSQKKKKRVTESQSHTKSTSKPVEPAQEASKDQNNSPVDSDVAQPQETESQTPVPDTNQSTPSPASGGSTTPSTPREGQSTPPPDIVPPLENKTSTAPNS